MELIKSSHIKNFIKDNINTTTLQTLFNLLTSKYPNQYEDIELVFQSGI